MILFSAPDVFGSATALANLRPYLRDRARVVTFGSQLTRRRFGAIPESTPTEFRAAGSTKGIIQRYSSSRIFHGYLFLVSGLVQADHS